MWYCCFVKNYVPISEEQLRVAIAYLIACPRVDPIWNDVASLGIVALVIDGATIANR